MKSSRTHLEVLGLEDSSPRKWPCHWLKDSTLFCTVEMLLENARNLAENLRRPFFVFLKWRSPEKNFEELFRLKKNFEDFFFGEHLLLCHWPPKGLSLASEFFCDLGLVSSTPPPITITQVINSISCQLQKEQSELCYSGIWNSGRLFCISIGVL